MSTQEPEPSARPDELLAEQERAFLRKRRQLMRRYGGEFVALYRGRVVAHGPDDEAVASQAFATLGDVPFFVGKVDSSSTVYDLPSPELAR